MMITPSLFPINFGPSIGTGFGSPPVERVSTQSGNNAISQMMYLENFSLLMRLSGVMKINVGKELPNVEAIKRLII